MKTTLEIRKWLNTIQSSDDSVNSCLDALKAHPESAELWNAYAAIMEQLGDFDEAELAFKQSVLIAPGNASIWNRLGILQKKTGRTVESESSFLKAILVDPEFAQLREESCFHSNELNLNCSIIQEEVSNDSPPNGNRNQPALRTFDTTIWLNVIDEFLQAGEHERAERIMAKAYQIHPDDEVICLKYATRLEQVRRTDEACHVLKKLAYIHPDNAEAWKRLALMTYAEGNQEGAIAILRKSISLGQAHQCRRLLALVLEEQGKTIEAIDVLSMDPCDAESLNLLGVLQHKSGQKEKAIVSYEEGLQLGGQDSSIQNNLGRLLEDLGDDEAATWAFDRAVELDKCNAIAWNNLGLALRRQEFFSEAETAFRLSISLAPYFKNPWLNLRDLSLSVPSLSQSIIGDPRFNDPNPGKWTQLGWNVFDETHHFQQLTKLLNLNEHQPANQDVLHQLALCMLNSKLYRDANDLLRRALALQNDSAPLWNLFGITCEKLGNVIESIACYERAIEHDNNYIGAIFNLKEAQVLCNEERKPKSFISDVAA